MTVVFASMGTGIGLNTDVTKGIFDRFRSLPISRSAPLTGTIMGDFFRYLISVAMVFGYGSLLGFRIGTNALSALGAVGLMFVFGFAVGWIWVLLGLYVKSPQSLQGFGFIVMFPLTFGSNVFVQTKTLPGWLQAWVKINPVTALTDATRGLLLAARSRPRPGTPSPGVSRSPPSSRRSPCAGTAASAKPTTFIPNGPGARHRHPASPATREPGYPRARLPASPATRDPGYPGAPAARLRDLTRLPCPIRTIAAQ